MDEPERIAPADDRQRTAEHVLKRLGYARVPPAPRTPEASASFWVQEAGVPRRTFPVYFPTPGDQALRADIDAWATRGSGGSGGGASPRRAIFVVGTDGDAESAWDRLREVAGGPLESEVSVLVVPPSGPSASAPHFHLRIVPPREVLRLATGVVVGLFRLSAATEGGHPVDFEEMLQHLKTRFGIDLYRSLGVRSDEDALFILYQLALRDSYAPGDPGANLHTLVLKPTGPAARLPWFAA